MFICNVLHKYLGFFFVSVYIYLLCLFFVIMCRDARPIRLHSSSHINEKPLQKFLCVLYKENKYKRKQPTKQIATGWSRYSKIMHK